MSQKFFKAEKGTCIKVCKDCGAVCSVSTSDVRVRSYRKKAPSFSYKCPLCKMMNSIGASEIPSSMLTQLYELA